MSIAFQDRVRSWMLKCFGPTIADDQKDRSHRFFEEATELAQASGCTKIEALMLVDYVYARPVGNIGQEVGGVMVTLAAMCSAFGLVMEQDADEELERIEIPDIMERIRQKQALKPRGLPIAEGDTPTKDQLRSPMRKQKTGSEVVCQFRDELLELVSCYNKTGDYEDAKTTQELAVRLNQFECTHFIASIAWPPRLTKDHGGLMIEVAGETSEPIRWSVEELLPKLREFEHVARGTGFMAHDVHRFIGWLAHGEPSIREVP